MRRESGHVDVRLPDPGEAGTLDDLVERLRALKVWAGDPSFAVITDRVNTAWTADGRPAAELAGKTTVVDVFRRGRRRLSADLVVAVVRALHPDTGYVAQWRQALRLVSGESAAAVPVRVRDTLPTDLAEFTGRGTELSRLTGGVHVIAGMAGVGKTRLAVHAAHRLGRDRPYDQVLFVNLRGFHPDRTQPPADPTAVLDGFLRLLGVPGPEIPPGLPERVALYRRRLEPLRALIVLDDAADVEQVRPLLPPGDRSTVLITSRRNLTGLPGAAHLPVEVFSPGEARHLLTRATPDVPAGDDPGAAARIAERCGRLPLALGLIAGHMRARPGWTLTDHADWLDERHQGGRLDAGVELALDLSYQHLPDELRRLLRLLALHPGQDLDAYAAAALTGDGGMPAIRAALDRLCADHLLREESAGRYTFHDLVRAYAAARARDEERPADRRSAQSRLYDHYLTTAGLAMDLLYPADAAQRPPVPPLTTPGPDLTDVDQARLWLDTERPTLMAVAETAPTHTVRLARTLYFYFNGVHITEAVTLHEHAVRAARDGGDPGELAHALTDLGIASRRAGRYDAAARHSAQALPLFQRSGHRAGQARALINLGVVEERTGEHTSAEQRFRQVVALARETGDRSGEAGALGHLGDLLRLLDRLDEAIECYRQALEIFREMGNRAGEGAAYGALGRLASRSGRFEEAVTWFRQGLALLRQAGNRLGEAYMLDGLGVAHTRLGRPAEAMILHEQALAMIAESDDHEFEMWVLNGLGEAAQAAGRAADAIGHHSAALERAVVVGIREQEARAHAGLGRAHHTLGDRARTADHCRRALEIHPGLPGADEIRDLMAASG
ncbi:tetratricopeptide repeat protein [Actinoplanes sp. G11-F43]|uniref:tetratricopeptide repeat protein n=1 Tax=Actinoplanes sp. G11-F43 TaxID=3424130 RepID=UPI003D333567